jgi:hypothetical protein
MEYCIVHTEGQQQVQIRQHRDAPEYTETRNNKNGTFSAYIQEDEGAR